MPVDNTIADCVSQFDLLYLCATPPHQFSHLYLYSTYDSCDAQLYNMKLCMKAKAKSDPEEARRIVRGYREIEGGRDMRLEKNSTTKGVVWELKTEKERGWT